MMTPPSTLHPFQAMVNKFHVLTGRETGDYVRPDNLRGETLGLRIRLIEEEHTELQEALASRDLIGFVDGICDLMFIVLGNFDVVGQVCGDRFGLLLSTTRHRGWEGFSAPVERESRVLKMLVEVALIWMRQCRDQGADFARFDLLEEITKQLAHVCSATGLDISPLFEAVSENNNSKAGGPVINGKLLKPPGYKPVDLKPPLRAQGVGEEWFG